MNSAIAQGDQKNFTHTVGGITKNSQNLKISKGPPPDKKLHFPYQTFQNWPDKLPINIRLYFWPRLHDTRSLMCRILFHVGSGLFYTDQHESDTFCSKIRKDSTSLQQTLLCFVYKHRNLIRNAPRPCRALIIGWFEHNLRKTSFRIPPAPEAIIGKFLKKEQVLNRPVKSVKKFDNDRTKTLTLRFKHTQNL